eukprot:5118759-Pleurochrysis_carterae.AAC.1
MIQPPLFRTHGAHTLVRACTCAVCSCDGRVQALASSLDGVGGMGACGAVAVISAARLGLREAVKKLIQAGARAIRGCDASSSGTGCQESMIAVDSTFRGNSWRLTETLSAVVEGERVEALRKAGQFF